MTLQELKNHVKGLCFVNVTPFDEDGTLNLAAYRDNLAFTLDS